MGRALKHYWSDRFLDCETIKHKCFRRTSLTGKIIRLDECYSSCWPCDKTLSQTLILAEVDNLSSIQCLSNTHIEAEISEFSQSFQWKHFSLYLLSQIYTWWLWSQYTNSVTACKHMHVHTLLCIHAYVHKCIHICQVICISSMQFF